MRLVSVEAMRVALAETLKIPIGTLDYSRASFRRPNQATRRQPVDVLYEAERLRPLIAHLGEAVRRAVGGEWSFEQDPRGVGVDVAIPSGQRLDFISDA